jgi:hypothetical protein
MSKRHASSEELYNEAVHRYSETKPLSNPELDTLLRWASEKYLESKNAAPPSETTMLVIRLLLAGRADSLLSSPQEGHADVRVKEIDLGRSVT